MIKPPQNFLFLTMFYLIFYIFHSFFIPGFRIKSGMTQSFDDLISIFHAIIKGGRGQESEVRRVDNI